MEHRIGSPQRIIDVSLGVNSARPRRALSWIAFALAVAGAGICVVLLRVVVAQPGDSFVSTVCAPSARINCEYVLASRWSRIGPLPTPIVGLAHYLLLAAWMAAIGAPNAAGRRWHVVPMTMTFAALCASVYLAFVMTTRLPVFCTWCMAAHAVNAALFVIAILLRPSRRSGESTAPAAEAMPAQRPHPSARRVVVVLGSSAAVIVVLALAAFAYRMQLVARQYQLALLDAANNPEYVLWRWREAPLQQVPVHRDDLSIGPADAAHTLVVFTDYECEMCAVFEPYAARLREMFPAELRIVLKHYPVSTACNPNVTRAFHYFSCDAALAMIAARRIASPEQARAFHEALFAFSRDLDARPYERIAQRQGLNVENLRAALVDEATTNRLREDIDLAYRLGVSGTPTLFLDGRRLENWRMLTTEVRPRIDVARTDELWRRLLAATQ